MNQPLPLTKLDTKLMGGDRYNIFCFACKKWRILQLNPLSGVWPELQKSVH